MSNRNLLTVDDLSKKTGIPKTTLIYYRKYYKSVGQLFTRQPFATKGIERLRWCIDESNIDELLKRVKKETAVRKKHLPGGVNSFSWTRSAIECLEAKMICKDCPNNYICMGDGVTLDRGKPPMKWKVLQIIEQYGYPPAYEG